MIDDGGVEREHSQDELDPVEPAARIAARCALAQQA